MKTLRRPPFVALRRGPQNFLAAILVGAAAFTTTIAPAADPLPSWNGGKARQSVVDFVAKTTKEGSPDFVPMPERIATFDNDGTLWCEQPLYVQLRFALDRVKALAPQHPEWKRKAPFARLLSTPREEKVAVTEHELLEIIMATHAGMTTGEFEQTVKDWLATAKHPKFNRPYTECVYQPMIELLTYLRANGFKTFIVSGGGIEFMRPWTEKVYGIPPEQVVGSSGRLKFGWRDNLPVLMKLPEVDFIDDKDGKPVGIQTHIGRLPVAAFGNSDGDRQMLEWAQAGGGARLIMLVHHDDAAHEFSYGPDSKIGTFSDALMAEAREKHWTVISMKRDWKQIFAFEKQ